MQTQLHGKTSAHDNLYRRNPLIYDIKMCYIFVHVSVSLKIHVLHREKVGFITQDMLRTNYSVFTDVCRLT